MAFSFDEIDATLLSEQIWPKWKEKFLVENEIKIVVQVNGKLRAKIMVSKNTSKEKIEKQAKADKNVQQHTNGKTIRKIIIVPDKLINIVTN